MLTSIGVGLAVAFNPLTSYFTSTKQGPGQGNRRVDQDRPGHDHPLRPVGRHGIERLGRSSSSPSASSSPCSSTAATGATYVLYAVAMVGIGMLSHTGNNVAMDSYGPISDNANGIGEMAWHDMEDEETKKARQIMADLDAVGNTTKAITKGVAIASAVIAAVSLFASFITDVGTRPAPARRRPRSWTPSASPTRRSSSACCSAGPCPGCSARFRSRPSARAAGLIVEEVRRQFRIPGMMEGKVKPDYARVVGISTAAAQKELIPLATISVLMPIAVGLILQVEALGGFLAGIILSGQLLAVFMANAGGAWDNAKKSIEDEPRDLAANTGKGSERHKAGVVGDTVGDPLKDTAGPALNPMIKVTNLVSLIAAPIIVKYSHMNWGVGIVAAVLLAAVVWAIRKSKREAPSLFEEDKARK